MQLEKWNYNNQDGPDPIFIVKPENACQGKGIFLVRDIRDIEAYYQNIGGSQGGGSQQSNFNGGSFSAPGGLYEPLHCVVQEYIDRPLLIDRMKFDLRLYVLLLGIDPPRIFLFKDGLCRLATSAYQQPSDYNMNNMTMHLTNYAVNKNSLSFMKNYTAIADFVGSKRSLKFVMRYLKKMLGADTTKLMKQIKDVIVKTILSAQPHIAHQYRSYQFDDHENSLCFEILGIDIMLDEKYKPYLLEINHAPSFATDSPLDEKIKGQVIYDTINLLGLTQKRKKNYKQINKMRMELRRIQPKKISLPTEIKEECRREFDELRNQYEFRNKGMFEMIYPVLDEFTLDPVQEQMASYQEMLENTQIQYCTKNNLKIPSNLQYRVDGKSKDKSKQKKQSGIKPKVNNAPEPSNVTQENIKMNSGNENSAQKKENNKDDKHQNNIQITKLKQYYKGIKSKIFTNNPKTKQHTSATKDQVQQQNNQQTQSNDNVIIHQSSEHLIKNINDYLGCNNSPQKFITQENGNLINSMQNNQEMQRFIENKMNSSKSQQQHNILHADEQLTNDHNLGNANQGGSKLLDPSPYANQMTPFERHIHKHLQINDSKHHVIKYKQQQQISQVKLYPNGTQGINQTPVVQKQWNMPLGAISNTNSQNFSNKKQNNNCLMIQSMNIQSHQPAAQAQRGRANNQQQLNVKQFQQQYQRNLNTLVNEKIKLDSCPSFEDYLVMYENQQNQFLDHYQKYMKKQHPTTMSNKQLEDISSPSKVPHELTYNILHKKTDSRKQNNSSNILSEQQKRDPKIFFDSSKQPPNLGRQRDPGGALSQNQENKHYGDLVIQTANNTAFQKQIVGSSQRATVQKNQESKNELNKSQESIGNDSNKEMKSALQSFDNETDSQFKTIQVKNQAKELNTDIANEMTQTYDIVQAISNQEPEEKIIISPSKRMVKDVRIRARSSINANNQKNRNNSSIIGTSNTQLANKDSFEQLYKDESQANQNKVARAIHQQAHKNSTNFYRKQEEDGETIIQDSVSEQKRAIENERLVKLNELRESHTKERYARNKSNLSITSTIQEQRSKQRRMSAGKEGPVHSRANQQQFIIPFQPELKNSDDHRQESREEDKEAVEIDLNQKYRNELAENATSLIGCSFLIQTIADKRIQNPQVQARGSGRQAIKNQRNMALPPKILPKVTKMNKQQSQVLNIQFNPNQTGQPASDHNANNDNTIKNKQKHQNHIVDTDTMTPLSIQQYKSPNVHSQNLKNQKKQILQKSFKVRQNKKSFKNFLGVRGLPVQQHVISRHELLSNSKNQKSSNKTNEAMPAIDMTSLNKNNKYSITNINPLSTEQSYLELKCKNSDSDGKDYIQGEVVQVLKKANPNNHSNKKLY